MTWRTVLGLLVAAVIVTIGSAVWLLGRRPVQSFGSETTVLSPPMPAADFALESADGPVMLRDLRGRHVVLFFGYTFCPDVCPLTMQRLDRALDLLGEDADRVQVVMITVDPERDTASRMRQYVSQFDPSFLGLSGTEEAVHRVATDYGIFHAKVEREDGGPYTMDHTATVLVLTDTGALVLLWPHGMEAETMAADLHTLLGG